MGKSLRSSLCEHWPEYLIEGCGLGCLMIAVGLFVTAFESPKSPLYVLIPADTVRAILLAAAIGIVLTFLIQSPWGKRSGAHINPAITLAFLRLNKIQPWDALFYVLAQIIGGALGVLAVAFILGSLFTDPPVRYAVTLPGAAGEIVACTAEVAISFVLMMAILVFTTSPRFARFTGIAIGCLVAVLVVIEAPLSGASMNPARTLASAFPGLMWQHVWIYLVGPTTGMLLAAELHINFRSNDTSGCAKLLHPCNIRCIHCGHLCASRANVSDNRSDVR
jgi:aquaporin Z